jgi:pilus assembly protein FimV
MVEFDMGNLSLDLNEPVTESTPISGSAPLEEPLETKFALAEEFRSLGDPDGARALAEEVLLEATGPLKVKAQAFLNALT